MGLMTQDEPQARNRYPPVEVLPVSGTTLDRRRKGDLGRFVQTRRRFIELQAASRNRPAYPCLNDCQHELARSAELTARCVLFECFL